MGSGQRMVEMTKRKRRRNIPDEALEKPETPLESEIQEIKKIKCPWCGSLKVWRRVEKSSTVYYQCCNCVDPDTENWTMFKVRVIDSG
jgi:ssDNA-binding Zn-finger/Zn-ribbon topoisomerase 1